MSRYVTVQEFSDGGLPGQLFNSLGSDAVEQALVMACDVADGYFRKRYAMPFVKTDGSAVADGIEVTGDIKRAVIGVAAFELLSRRGFTPGAAQDAIIVDRRDKALEWLGDVSRGVVELAMTDSTAPVEENGSLACSAPPQSLSYNTPRDRINSYDPNYAGYWFDE